MTYKIEHSRLNLQKFLYKVSSHGKGRQGYQGDEVGIDSYLEHGPRHVHVDAVVRRPPLQVTLVVGLVDRRVELSVDFRDPTSINM